MHALGERKNWNKIPEVNEAPCALCSLFCRCVEVVKASQYVELANDLEINKAITYLRQKDFNQVSATQPACSLVSPSSACREAALTNAIGGLYP